MVGKRGREGLGSRPVGRALKIRQMEVLGITLCVQELMDQAKAGECSSQLLAKRGAGQRGCSGGADCPG